MVLEKTLESPLDCKEIQPVHSKGDQPWVFFGRTDAEVNKIYCGLTYLIQWDFFFPNITGKPLVKESIFEKISEKEKRS